MKTHVALGLLCTLGCTHVALPPNEALSEEGSIIGGTLHTGDPAVVMVREQNVQDLSGNNCTGTLISPHVVLTAAHCLDATHPVRYTVYAAPNWRTAKPSEVLAVSQIAMHPDYQNGQADHDIGVVILAEAARITPVPHLRKTVAHEAWTAVGTSLRLIGYGITACGNSDGGIKRLVTSQYIKARSKVLEVDVRERGSCLGDSGGPGLFRVRDQEYVVGVNSSVTGVPVGTDANGNDILGEFREHEGRQARVDVNLPFIDAYVAKFDPGWLVEPAEPPGPARLDNMVSGAVTLAQPSLWVVENVKPGSVFRIAMTGEGAIDMYVRAATQPTLTAFDCRPNIAGANERCEVIVPAGAAPQQVFFMAYGDGSFSFAYDWEVERE